MNAALEVGISSEWISWPADGAVLDSRCSCSEGRGQGSYGVAIMAIARQDIE